MIECLTGRCGIGGGLENKAQTELLFIRLVHCGQSCWWRTGMNRWKALPSLNSHSSRNWEPLPSCNSGTSGSVFCPPDKGMKKVKNHCIRFLREGSPIFCRQETVVFLIIFVSWRMVYLQSRETGITVVLDLTFWKEAYTCRCCGIDKELRKISKKSVCL